MECCGVSQPDFQVSGQEECCFFQQLEFPLQVKRGSNGWLVGDTLLPFNTTSFSSADLLAEWMTANDPYGHQWTAFSSGNGFMFCADVREDLCGLYQEIVHTDSCFVCLASFTFVDGEILVDGIPFDASSSSVIDSGVVIESEVEVFDFDVDSPESFAEWARRAAPGVDWQVYLDSGQYSLCGFVGCDRECDYRGLSYEGHEFNCMGRRLSFPLYYGADDGAVIDGVLVSFDGPGQFDRPSQLVAWMNNNDDNVWSAVPNDDGTFDICGFVENGGDYKALWFSDEPLCCCQIVGQEYPMSYSFQADGWMVNGEFIGFDGNGTWETALEHATWMTTNDPNGNEWRAVRSPEGGWDICALMPSEQKPQYGGIVSQSVCTVRIPIAGNYPLRYSPNFGLEVNGEFIAYSNEGFGFIYTPEEMVEWLNANDPIGNVWAIDPNDRKSFVTGASQEVCAYYDDFQVARNACAVSMPPDFVEFPYTTQTGFGIWCGGVFFSLGGSADEITSSQNNGNVIIPTGDWLADWLTSQSNSETKWFYDEETGNFAANAPVEQCELYSRQFLAPREVCLGEFQFPLFYRPCFDGWQTPPQGFSFFPDGQTSFDSPEDLSDWLNDNDPFGFIWEANLVDRGTCTFEICGSVSSGNVFNSLIGNLLFTDPPVCEIAARNYPVNYTNGADGWTVNGTFIPFAENSGTGTPGTGSFANAKAQASWMTSNDPNCNEWVAFQNPGGAWRICSYTVNPVQAGAYTGNID